MARGELKWAVPVLQAGYRAQPGGLGLDRRPATESWGMNCPGRRLERPSATVKLTSVVPQCDQLGKARRIRPVDCLAYRLSGSGPIPDAFAGGGLGLGTFQADLQPGRLPACPQPPACVLDRSAYEKHLCPEHELSAAILLLLRHETTCDGRSEAGSGLQTGTAGDREFLPPARSRAQPGGRVPPYGGSSKAPEFHGA